MSKHTVFLLILTVTLNLRAVSADEDGSRFDKPLDRATSEMLNVPFVPDSSSAETDTLELKASTHKPDSIQTEKKEFSVEMTDTVTVVSGTAGKVDTPKSLPVVYTEENEPESLDLEGNKLTTDIIRLHPDDKYIPRRIENRAWNVGEQLTFELTYSFYTAGVATMSVTGIERVNGGMCYHIKTTANSNDFISSFYKVRDTVDSYIDTLGIFSRRIEKRLREGRYKSDRFVDFHHDRLIALSTQKKYAVTEIPPHIQDILSALYYLRTFDLEVGKSEEVLVYADGQVYPLKVNVYKREKITVPAGTFNCLKIEPILQSEGIFRQKGKIIVWLSDDIYKIPVKMSSKVIIGSIASQLISYKTGVVR
ncbi:DUF3108 domain-containing protein [bacterium]|nr:DUF3108 domain-containing protein [bacterium]